MYSVQAAVAETQARDKLNFARKLFERALQESSAAESPLAGIVVIFDSADGGQASTTLVSLKIVARGENFRGSFLAIVLTRSAGDIPGHSQKTMGLFSGEVRELLSSFDRQCFHDSDVLQQILR